MNSCACVPLEKYQHIGFEMHECELIMTEFLFGVNYLFKTNTEMLSQLLVPAMPTCNNSETSVGHLNKNASHCERILVASGSCLNTTMGSGTV